MTALHHQPDIETPDHGPLSFLNAIGSRTLIFMGLEQIGVIEQVSYLRFINYRVTIHLGTNPRRVTASNLEQAKVFARQEVDEFFARTPLKLEVRG